MHSIRTIQLSLGLNMIVPALVVLYSVGLFPLNFLTGLCAGILCSAGSSLQITLDSPQEGPEAEGPEVEEEAEAEGPEVEEEEGAEGPAPHED
jgi:hypothetical protein